MATVAEKDASKVQTIGYVMPIAMHDPTTLTLWYGGTANHQTTTL
jgi:hypothetical protein